MATESVFGPQASRSKSDGSNSTRSEMPGRALRYILGVLLAFGALNALGGGYYGLSGAKGVPTEWLQGGPFRDYFIPSLFLLVVVGGAFLLAAAAVFGRWPRSRRFAFGAGLIVLGWLAVQVSIIGYVSWMQPTTAVAGIVIVTLAWRLDEPGTRMARREEKRRGKIVR
jgi:peptidoglycan/LPS O-acetylase OafA/YrhL